VGSNFLFAVESVKKFPKKVSLFFLPAEKFSRVFFMSRQNFFWIIFKNPRAKKKFRDIFDWREFKKKSVSLPIVLLESFYPDNKAFFLPDLILK